MDSSPSTIEKRLPTGVQASINAWVDEIANRNIALNSDGNGPVPLAVSSTARVTKNAAKTGARRATTKSLTNVVRPVVIPESQLLPIAAPGGKKTGKTRNWNQTSLGSSARKITVHSFQRKDPAPTQNTVPPSFRRAMPAF